MTAALVEAARAIVRARDFYAEHTAYDPADFHPEADQGFDDWAADILETALAAEPDPLDEALALIGRMLDPEHPADEAVAFLAAHGRLRVVTPTPEPDAHSARVKVTDDLRNVAYIHHNANGWRCTLANGISASMFYAGISGDDTGFRFKLADCKTAAEVLALVRATVSRRHVAELV